MTTLTDFPVRGQWQPRPVLTDAAVGCLGALCLLAVFAVQGFPSLTDARGDNDSLLRLVEVHDLIAGQGWFDLHQYRMGLEGGFVMHWSRLVDAPIAAIILAVEAAGGSPALADAVAGVAWPLLLFAAALFFLMRSVRHGADEWALLPAAVVGATGLYMTGIFQPGSLDHHNVQLVLALAMLSFLLAPSSFRSGAAAGACAALMLAVGMETVPYIAAGGAAAAVSLLVLGPAERPRAAGFGIALAVLSAAVMLATIRPGEWSAVHCDAFSVAQFAAALVSGAGLAAVALLPAANANFRRRAAALAVLAVALAAIVVLQFPQCLVSPYGGLDPQLRHFWLDHVSEAQPVTTLILKRPTLAAGSYVTPLLALGILALGLVGRGLSRERLVVGVLLLAAVLVSFWQVRGAMFSVPFAVVPLAVWIGARRKAAAARPATATTLKMLAAWVVSVSIVWSVMAAGLAAAFERVAAGGSGVAAAAADEGGSCYNAADYAALAALPAGTVLASSNLGAPILRYTAHRVFAGPYHRDVAGMLAVLDAFMAPPDEAARAARALHVDFVAVCPGNPETDLLAEWAPDGLMAALRKGDVPAWLDPVDTAPGAALGIYRVAGVPATR